MELPVVLIPAYKPDQKMIDLIQSLLDSGFEKILVVDDGSGEPYSETFAKAAQLGCRVLVHSINMGKGRSLKTGLNECLLNKMDKSGVITADADGQHAIGDIVRIAAAMAENADALILGVRQFTGKVPLRNRLGNTITRVLFRIIHGKRIQDTQTGLRGIPSCHIPLMLSLSGERYDYEMNMLITIRPNEINLVQVPIETIYIDGNAHSHYKVFADSVRIYRLLFKYAGSSLVATIIEYLLFTLMNLSFPDQIFFSVVIARAASSTVNFSINRNLVFKRKNTGKNAIFKYYSLVIAIMFASYCLIKFFAGVIGINVYISKIMADALLSTMSFIIQREYVYRK